MPDAGPLRWGVIASTSMVSRLAVLPAIEASATAQLVAVGSRSGPPEGAARLGAPRAYPSYEEVLADPDVEAVYVPLPNSLHAEWVGAAAAAGKHVLCEKPLARSAAEAAAMARVCADAGVHLAEAYMTPFHPRHGAFVDLCRSGLGEPRFASAAFTGRLTRADDHRWEPAMGGGCLLDVGIYCLAPLLAVAGRDPVSVAATAVVTPKGVDSSFSGFLDFGDGFTGAFRCSFDAPEEQTLEVVGTEGAAALDRAFTPGPQDTVIATRDGDGHRGERLSGADDPYRLMVEHFADCVRRGAPPARPPAESVRLLSLVDRLREAAGMGPGDAGVGA